jgi:hypothetical protein
MERTSSSEIWVLAGSSRRHIPEDAILLSHHCKSFKSFFEGKWQHILFINRLYLNILTEFLAQSQHSISTARTNWLMIIRGTDAVYSENHKRCKYTVCCQNAELFNVKAGCCIHKHYPLEGKNFWTNYVSANFTGGGGGILINLWPEPANPRVLLLFIKFPHF